MGFHGGKIGPVRSACEMGVVRLGSEGRISSLGLDVDFALLFLSKLGGTLNIKSCLIIKNYQEEKSYPMEKGINKKRGKSDNCEEKVGSLKIEIIITSLLELKLHLSYYHAYPR